MYPLLTMRALIALLLVVCAMAFPAPVLAQGAAIELSVLDLATTDAVDNARALTVAIERAITRAEGWSLAPGDYSLEVLTAALDCDELPDEPCLERIADEVESDRLIWGTVERSGAEVLAKLHYWERGGGRSETEVRYSANLTDAADDALLAVAQGAFGELLGLAGGTLVVIAGTGAGEVSIDGEPRGQLVAGRLEVNLPAGEYKVLVRVADARPSRARATVRPGTRTELELRLIPVAQPLGEVTEAAPPERAAPSGKRRLGYALIGLGGGVALAGGAFTAVTMVQRGDDEFERYRETVARDQDVCDIAAARGDTDIVDKCTANRTARRLAWILTPTGLAVAGVGIAVVAGAPGRSTASSGAMRLKGQVGFGPRGASAGVVYHF